MSVVSTEQLNSLELACNKVFLDLQSRLGETLRVTQQAAGGAEALQRFDVAADPSACYERAHC
jgi:hypothetical protein